MSAVALHGLLGISVADTLQSNSDAAQCSKSLDSSGASRSCLRIWMTATGCAMNRHYNQGAAFTANTNEEKWMEKPKHMDGYFSAKKLHMLEAPSAQSTDRSQFSSLVVLQW